METNDLETNGATPAKQREEQWKLCSKASENDSAWIASRIRGELIDQIVVLVVLMSKGASRDMRPCLGSRGSPRLVIVQDAGVVEVVMCVLPS